MKTYGSGVHEEKVEDYSEYQEKIFCAKEGELRQILSRIKESSLTKEDKMKLFDEFILVIIKENTLFKMAKAKEPTTGIRNGKLFCFNCGEYYDISSTPQPINMLMVIMKQFEKDHKKCSKTWVEPVAEPDENDSSISIRNNADWWLANGERGISSETMFYYLDNRKTRISRSESHPHVPSDFKRCYLLLKAVPQWRQPSYLNKMKAVSKEWRALVDNWDKLETMLEEQIRTNKANGMYDFMQSLYK